MGRIIAQDVHLEYALRWVKREDPHKVSICSDLVLQLMTAQIDIEEFFDKVWFRWWHLNNTVPTYTDIDNLIKEMEEKWHRYDHPRRDDRMVDRSHYLKLKDLSGSTEYNNW